MSGEVNVIPTLRKFRGGASRSIFGGGQSRGGGQLKKPPCIFSLMVDSQVSGAAEFMGCFKKSGET